MKRKISISATITFTVIVATVVFATTSLYTSNKINEQVADMKQREYMYKKIANIEQEVRANYYGAFDENALMDSIARGYMAGINDRYAQYYTAKEYTDLLNKLEGTKVGIGLEISKDGSGYIKVNKVYETSPAFESGLLADDLIIEVDGKSVTSETYEEIVASLEGEVGTTVKLKTRRGAEEIDYEITRRKYELPSVSFKMIENSDIGYIRITEFRDATTTQFIKAVDSLIASGVNGLIFDVRDNGGGTLDSATSMLDYLLPEGDIVSVTNKSGVTTVMATSDAYEIDIPMVVLINEKTASAAELFAQALMDYEKASTVGTTTYGKGVMQTIIKLSDGSAINITTARYNPPKSPNFDGIGVKPNFEVKMSADVLTDAQFAKAKEVIEAIKVKEGIITAPSSSEITEDGDDAESSSSEEVAEESSSSK